MTERSDTGTLVGRPHLPSWERFDADQQKDRGTERFRKHEVDLNPDGDDWLDEVKGPDTEDQRPINMGEMMERLGSLPHFSISLDPEKLAAIDVSKYAYGDRSIQKEKLEDNLRRMLEVFAKLPELEFKHGGSYYIYGPNGSGKSVLSQAIMIAVQRRWHQLRLTTQEVDGTNVLFSKQFTPKFPRDINGGSSHLGTSDETNGKELILAISECIDVDDLVTAESSKAQANFESDVASGVYFSLGAAASTGIGLSGAQAVNSFVIENVSNKVGFGNRPELTAVILDEPETSRDRRQLRNLKNEIESIRMRMGKETIAIVPTHSESIYRDTAAQRIDLDYPERGIHSPEDADVVGAIEIDHLNPEQLLILANMATARAREMNQQGK